MTGDDEAADRAPARAATIGETTGPTLPSGVTAVGSHGVRDHVVWSQPITVRRTSDDEGTDSVRSALCSRHPDAVVRRGFTLAWRDNEGALEHGGTVQFSLQLPMVEVAGSIWDERATGATRFTGPTVDGPGLV